MRILVFSFQKFFFTLKTGVVIKTTGSWHTVMDGETIQQCKIRGRLREKDTRLTNPVAVGDVVHYEYDSHKSGIITEIEPRKNYIIRRATNLSREAHILAANIDQAFLMITLTMPETPLEFVDRFILTAEAYHIPVHIIVNKTDLLVNDQLVVLENIKETYGYAGYNCITISVKENSGIDQLIHLMTDKTNLLAGNSGVGKSSLIQLMCPETNLKIGEISVSHKTGKHATTYAEMIPLPYGGYVIDTPGIRGFGVFDIEKNEIALYFTDIFKLSHNCSYYNCTHVHEPGCAVRIAAENGTLASSRYRSYLNIFLDPHNKYRSG